jgi:hypothetical protein
VEGYWCTSIFCSYQTNICWYWWNCWPSLFKLSFHNIQLWSSISVFLKENLSLQDIRSSKGVWITGTSIKFTGHSHIPQKRCSDSYCSFGLVMNNHLLDQTNFYWTLPYVRQTLWMTGISQPGHDSNSQPLIWNGLLTCTQVDVHWILVM